MSSVALAGCASAASTFEPSALTPNQIIRALCPNGSRTVVYAEGGFDSTEINYQPNGLNEGLTLRTRLGYHPGVQNPTVIPWTVTYGNPVDPVTLGTVREDTRISSGTIDIGGTIFTFKFLKRAGSGPVYYEC